MRYLIQCTNCHQSFTPLAEDLKLLDKGHLTEQEIPCLHCYDYEPCTDYSISEMDSKL